MKNEYGPKEELTLDTVVKISMEAANSNIEKIDEESLKKIATFKDWNKLSEHTKSKILKCILYFDKKCIADALYKTYIFASLGVMALKTNLNFSKLSLDALITMSDYLLDYNISAYQEEIDLFCKGEETIIEQVCQFEKDPDIDRFWYIEYFDDLANEMVSDVSNQEELSGYHAYISNILKTNTKEQLQEKANFKQKKEQLYEAIDEISINF